MHMRMCVSIRSEVDDGRQRPRAADRQDQLSGEGRSKALIQRLERVEEREMEAVRLGQQRCLVSFLNIISLFRYSAIYLL